MLKKLFVRSLDESEHQGFIDSALDTGIDNFKGHASCPFGDVLSLVQRGLIGGFLGRLGMTSTMASN